MRALLLLVLLLPAGTASAVRPTEGGLFSFDAEDDVEYWDEPTGQVRVFYSVDGPSATRLNDDDGDGIPDFAQDVALTSAEVLAFYEDERGLRRPLGEEEMGLDPLGGSYALDVYLVDFDGNGDGAFGIDTCINAPRHCSGFLQIDNYPGGYPSLQNAIDVLTSHELFHGIQNAYDSEQDVWFSEGTATWGEVQWDPDSVDFLWFADEYLEDTGRSLDRPPSGPVPSFAYGTCLWFDFLTTRHDVDLMSTLLEATETPTGVGVDTLAEMEALIVAEGDTLEDAWFEFVSWNLATGPRAGAADSHRYAADLDGILAEAEGSAIDDDNRFYPLAATYYRLDHDGGAIWFGAEEAAPELRFALFPVEGGADDGPVEPAVDMWTADQAGAWSIAAGEDLEAGGYWLLGTYPMIADESIKVRFCLGSQDDAAACGPVVGDADDDDDDSEGDDDGTPADDDDDDDDGCGCTVEGRPATGVSWITAALLVLAGRRFRR